MAYSCYMSFTLFRLSDMTDAVCDLGYYGDTQIGGGIFGDDYLYGVDDWMEEIIIRAGWWMDL